MQQTIVTKDVFAGFAANVQENRRKANLGVKDKDKRKEIDDEYDALVARVAGNSPSQADVKAAQDELLKRAATAAKPRERRDAQNLYAFLNRVALWLD